MIYFSNVSFNIVHSFILCGFGSLIGYVLPLIYNDSNLVIPINKVLGVIYSENLVALSLKNSFNIV